MLNEKKNKWPVKIECKSYKEKSLQDNDIRWGQLSKFVVLKHLNFLTKSLGYQMYKPINIYLNQFPHTFIQLCTN